MEIPATSWITFIASAARYCVYIRRGEAVGVITPSFLRASLRRSFLDLSWKFRVRATRAEDERQSDEEEEEDRNGGYSAPKGRARREIGAHHRQKLRLTEATSPSAKGERGMNG